MKLIALIVGVVFLIIIGWVGVEVAKIAIHRRRRGLPIWRNKVAPQPAGVELKRPLEEKGRNEDTVAVKGRADMAAIPAKSEVAVTLVFTPHAAESDFDAICRPILERAFQEAAKQGQSLVILKEFIGPDLGSIEQLYPQYEAAELVKSARSVPAVQSAFAELLRGCRKMYEETLAAAQRGIAPALSENQSSGFESAFLNWAGSTQAKVIFEDVTFESWLSSLEMEVAESRLNTELQTSGFESLQQRERFFEIKKQWVDAAAFNLISRNSAVAKQALAQMQAGNPVSVVIGTAHLGIAKILRAAGVKVVEPPSTDYSTTGPTGTLIAQIADGADVQPRDIRLAALRDNVVEALYNCRSELSPGEPITSELLSRANGLAMKWGEEDASNLLSALSSDRWLELVERWLLKHASPEDCKYFGVVER